MGRKIRDEKKDDILTMRENGYTHNEIARVLHISIKSVVRTINEERDRQNIKTHGMKGMRNTFRIRNKAIREVVERRGYNVADFVRLVKCSDTTADRVFDNDPSVRLTIPQIKRICFICNKKFEEVFSDEPQ